MAQVFLAPDDEPEMQRAKAEARKTFRFFWRELSWEKRRIIPGLDLACVKVPFSDPPGTERRGQNPSVEEMWLNEIDFDGRFITGTLINSPNWLKSVQEGDTKQIPLKDISDWMYAIQGRVYGAYTVNLIRSRMSRAERKSHDSAWGLDFGDPNAIEVVPAEWFGKKSKGGFLAKIFGRSTPPPPFNVDTAEHPMAANMESSFREHLKQHPAHVHQKGENGWTFLHQQALAGDARGVAILLENGADPNVPTNHGMTPLQLARSLAWNQVVEVLIKHGAK